MTLKPNIATGCRTELQWRSLPGSQHVPIKIFNKCRAICFHTRSHCCISLHLVHLAASGENAPGVAKHMPKRLINKNGFLHPVGVPKNRCPSTHRTAFSWYFLILCDRWPQMSNEFTTSEDAGNEVLPGGIYLMQYLMRYSSIWDIQVFAVSKSDSYVYIYVFLIAWTIIREKKASLAKDFLSWVTWMSSNIQTFSVSVL